MSFIGDRVSHQLNQQGIRVVSPDGGFYNLADFSAYRENLHRAGITNARELCQRMLESTGIAGLPGDDFGLQGLLVRFAFVDFDGNGLLHKVMNEESHKLDNSTPELKRIFSAADKLGEWLNQL